MGCIGGGQLGRMLALAGAPLDVRFRFLDPSAEACAGDVGDLLVGAYDDLELLDRLADGADAVTFEFENVPVESARRVAAVPDARALEQGHDRLVEKQLFASLGIPTARFGTLDEAGVPALVKSRQLGYDGKGQRRVESHEAIGQNELAEEVVPFERELSIVAVRGRDGDTRFYPLAENEHRGGILAVSRAPAAGAPQEQAEEIATKLLNALGYVGVLAVELFDVGGTLLANEFAPRVHNTGHWTIDGATTSQFENHVRAVLGRPLGSTKPLGESVMVNLVGEVPPVASLLAVPGAHVHLYGKKPRAGRKLGHVTLVDADEDAIELVTGLAAAEWSSYADDSSRGRSRRFACGCASK
jgi:5-(carboxyamino)imidazole ribonucleotide synthase